MQSSQSLFAPVALLPNGWETDVRIDIDNQGWIRSVDSNAVAHKHDARLSNRLLLPSPANVHSHAFQRALAGRTQRRGSSDDSFWSWRDLMYRLVGALTPDTLGAITAQAQMEMLEAGFAAVAEFHYVHHDRDGKPYQDVAELSARVMEAAQQTGIGLTLLPVVYCAGGMDGSPPTHEQRRFACTADEYARLWQAAAPTVAGGPHDWRLGVAPHSLRAAPLEALNMATSLSPVEPVHIHIAEQRLEVEQVRAARGARPVEWLLEHCDVNERWCLIHATHSTDQERSDIAERGAVVGLCPLTEADLGDGFFAAQTFLRQGGKIGLGTDSNVRISLPEEIKMLEYGQRLRHQRRNVLAEPEASTGRTVYNTVLAGGAQALGRQTGRIEPGYLADFVSLDREAIELVELTDDDALDAWIFSSNQRLVKDVWSAGRQVVVNGRHIAHGEIETAFRKAMRAIALAI
ncbi:MAG: formimidoylglutamate deiminase [Gammaproteobacteria bacterium]|nr:formimidoylglutamate deiminase [Gammaproteobacteria bacterium]